MSNVRPELAETEEAAAGGMDDRMVRLERLVENLSSEIVKLARPPPSQASSAPGTSGRNSCNVLFGMRNVARVSRLVLTGLIN